MPALGRVLDCERILCKSIERCAAICNYTPNMYNKDQCIVLSIEPEGIALYIMQPSSCNL